jgi:cobalt-zinc-cadmium efflux system membrane fusion protein
MTRRLDQSRGSAVLPALLFVLVGIAVGAGAVWFLRGPATPATTDAKNDAAKPALPQGTIEIPEAAQRNAAMAVTTVQPHPLPSAIEVTGNVAPDEARVAHIRPIARGVISRVLVSLGARVTAGQPLATLDNIELGEVISSYRSEVAALTQARTDLEVKRRAVERADELIKLEAIAQQVLEQRRAELRNAEAAVASQQSRVSRFEEQMHRFGMSEQEVEAIGRETSDHRESSHASIRAPFTGVVTKLAAASGESVDPEDELFTVTDIATVWVMADVYEKDIAKVRRGAEVRVRVDAYSDRTFRGQVGYISDVIDPQTRTAKVRCVVANPDAALKIDMFAKVTVPTGEAHAGLAVPTAAVQSINGQPVVFIRQSPTRFERRGVALGATAGDTVEVVMGLNPGDAVVTAGSFYLKTALLRDLIGED